MMTESAKQKKIDRQCQRYPLLHKPTGVRYQVAYECAGIAELHPISGPPKYASAADLENHDVWGSCK